ncbi:MAG: hypothetical protein CXT75_01700, partial [Methanobacteriota archaeon]
IVDAAASGSELELEIIEGNYWIHIVGWNGDQDSSKSFTSITDGGRYVEDTDSHNYYRFNGNLLDSSGNERHLTAVGTPTTSATGKMGNGLTLDGSGEYVWHQAEVNFFTQDWSFEAWIKPADIGDSSTSIPILFIGDGTTGIGTIDEGDDELQIGMRDGHLELCYDSCTGGLSDKKWFNSETEWVTGKWYHIAVSYDVDGNDPQPGYNAFINGERVSGEPDATGFKTPTDTNFPASSEYYIGAGELSGSTGIADFNGIIDEVRFTKYEKNAFAGGLMISKVVPSTNTVTIYNSGDFTMDLTGVDIWNGASSCGFSGTLASEATTTCTLTVGTTDGIRMLDDDGDNDASSDIGFSEDTKDWMIDGVCWNTGSGTDGSCDSAADPLIDAGLWTEDTYVNLGSEAWIYLTTTGNNDEAVSDWSAIPEFGTLLMPIASVLMIVGYNYRKREQLES